jgi:hypothetical protein
MYFEPQSGGLCRKHAVNMAIRNLTSSTKIIDSGDALKDHAKNMAKVYRVSDEKLLTDFDAVMTDGCTLPSWCFNELAPKVVTINVPKGYFTDDEVSLQALSHFKDGLLGAMVYTDSHIWTVDNVNHMELDSLRRPVGINEDILMYFKSHPNRMFGYVMFLPSLKSALKFLRFMMKEDALLVQEDDKTFERVLARPLEAKSSEADRNFVLARWGNRAIWIAQCLRAGYKHGGPLIKDFCDKLSKKIVARYYLIRLLTDEDFENFTRGLTKNILQTFETDDDS